MLNLIGISKAQVRVKQAKTEDSVLEFVRDRIRNYLAHHYGEGNKLSTTSAQLVVKRFIDGVERRVLAIKIANETWNFVPLETDRDDVEQIQAVIEGLEEYKTQLFNFSKWVDFNVGKKKENRIPRPDSWDSAPTLEEVA